MARTAVFMSLVLPVVHVIFFICCTCGGRLTEKLETNLTSTDILMNLDKRQIDKRNNITCPPPYDPVGDHCLFIDGHMRGSWAYMRQVCLTIEGDLVSLKDLNMLFDISNYIKENGLTDMSYWVGAGDQQQEGLWMWTYDGSNVKMRTPLWGHWNQSQPDGGEDEDCGMLSKNDYYYMHDDNCESINGLICQPNNFKEFASPGESKITKQRDMSTPYSECPSPFEMIGDACLMVHPEQFYTWSQAREFCASDYTHMAKINDANQLGYLYDYLITNGTPANYWLQGNDQETEEKWHWHDVTPVKRGTPFWDVNNGTSQEPSGGTLENCLYIGYYDSYFFRDANCNNTLAVICQYDLL